MDSSLKSPSYRCVELPGNVCGTEDENAFAVAAHTVHLDEQFGLDASRRFRFAFTARST